jgi:hypothetical protein
MWEKLPGIQMVQVFHDKIKIFTIWIQSTYDPDSNGFRNTDHFVAWLIITISNPVVPEIPMVAVS